MGNTRTAHKKSRNGCLHCKRLRVKCDETKPQCDYCVRNGRRCEYSISDKEAMTGRPLDGTATFKIDGAESTEPFASFTQPEPYTALVEYIPSPANSSDESPFDKLTPMRGNWLQLSDLELNVLEFFLQRASVYLSVGIPELTLFWRSNGLQLVAKSQMLMYNLVALAQVFGCPGIDADVSLMTLTSANKISRSIATQSASPMELIVAAFLLSALSCMDPDIPIVSFDGKVDLLGLCQGPQNLMRIHKDYFKKAHLPICEPCKSLPKVRPNNPSEIITYLDDVLKRCLDLGLCSGEEEQCYVETLNAFADAIENGFRRQSSWHIAMFVCSTSFEFLIFCRAKRPFAMCIMLFFCSLEILAKGNSATNFWKKNWLFSEEIRGLLPAQLMDVVDSAQKLVDGKKFPMVRESVLNLHRQALRRMIVASSKTWTS
jgi:Fungal Zn(2)-Cys(6) binuclear cluster domain